MERKKLVLANGKVFEGMGYRDAIAEIVFNTSMVGYQEIVSDPSYADQIVLMTYPLIGNYGINDEDFESNMCALKGLIVKECNDHPSNFRFTKSLGDLLEEKNVALLTGIDTRELTRIIRDQGAMVGCIVDSSVSNEEAMKKIKEYKIPHNQVSTVSTKKPWVSKSKNPKFSVVCLDFGAKLSIIRQLNENHCNVTLLPSTSSIEEIMKYRPDGLFLSNGPGDPMDNPSAIEVVKTLKGKLPIFGICLGHQIMSVAAGAKTEKMHFGHRGSNHPVKNVKTGRIEITSQNHSYAVLGNSIKDSDLEITHINLIDNTVEGTRNDEKMYFSVQFHPESAAGPEDSKYLFKTFISYMQRHKEELKCQKD